MSDLQEVARRDESVSSLPPAPENVQVIGPPSPVPEITRPYEKSSCSRVSLSHFDQEGVSQLRRMLTHQSASPRGPETVLLSESLETILVPTTGPFDFEKTLRTVMKKYVIASPPRIHS